MDGRTDGRTGGRAAKPKFPLMCLQPQFFLLLAVYVAMDRITYTRHFAKLSATPPLLQSAELETNWFLQRKRLLVRELPRSRGLTKN
jgi:hypothetical protein